MSALPVTDQNIVGRWTQADVDRFEKTPYYNAKAEVLHREKWKGIGRLLTASVPWTPNQGSIQRRPAITGSPVVRQQARPRALVQGDPLTDMPDTSETKHDLLVYEHEFVTQHFNYLPDFQDFFGSHLKPSHDALLRDITIFEDLFYRTSIWEHSPYIYVCGVGLIEAPTPENLFMTTKGKTDEWLLANVFKPVIEKKGYFSLQELYNIIHGVSEEIGMIPYAKEANEANDNIPLDEQYAAMISKEVWLNWVEDPWVKENRPIDMNIITKGFEGNFFGQCRAMRQTYPERYLINAGFTTSTLPAPEERIVNGPLNGRIRRTDDWRRNAQIEVSYIFGAPGYSKLKTGPTPATFAQARDGKPFNWNGKPILTKDFLIPRTDVNGQRREVVNNGRFLRYETTLAMGIARDNPQQVLPVVYLRQNPTLRLA